MLRNKKSVFFMVFMEDIQNISLFVGVDFSTNDFATFGTSLGYLLKSVVARIILLHFTEILATK
jgi:hypothetical protein